MKYYNKSILVMAFLLTAVVGCNNQDPNDPLPGMPPLVDGTQIINAKPGEWLSHGRTYDEQRFSPLKQISDKNMSALA